MWDIDTCIWHVCVFVKTKRKKENFSKVSSWWFIYTLFLCPFAYLALFKYLSFIHHRQQHTLNSKIFRVFRHSSSSYLACVLCIASTWFGITGAFVVHIVSLNRNNSLFTSNHINFNWSESYHIEPSNVFFPVVVVVPIQTDKYYFIFIENHTMRKGVGNVCTHMWLWLAGWLPIVRLKPNVPHIHNTSPSSSSSYVQCTHIIL